jgi:hypothetical protein
MLAWVCWDEFVNLKSPYTVRWMEKCNDAHIAALRIIMRGTLSQAVASREYNIESNSSETGQLMSALLMAAMSKLAAMRVTAPVVLDEAEDTVTKLMRGLFGNFLTTAGSGVRPLSMVWQLFGVDPRYDIPTTDVEWRWYETAVALYPYTGWPLKQFYVNLEKLLDKVIIRVVTKSENLDQIRGNRVQKMIRYCKLRNILLEHSRTIITIFMRMFTTDGIDLVAVSARLLERLPQQLDRQTHGYTEMIKYLEHLSEGGQRRVKDDLVAANIYSTRSAAFRELKTKVSQASEGGDWAKMKEYCKALMDEQVEIAALWNIEPQSLKIQNLKPYREILDADFGEDVDQDTKTKTHELTRRILSDAEKKRVPWQVGKEGQYGNAIEPLDEAFLNEILLGGNPESLDTIDSDKQLVPMTTDIIEKQINNEFTQLMSKLRPSFVAAMQKPLSAEAVCDIMNVSVTAMRVFVKALNPDFVWEDLGKNFKGVILDLLKERSNRVESRPVRKLLELGVEKSTLQIEG